MYPAQVNSPMTFLSADIDAVQIDISLEDVTKLPEAPSIVTIGQGESAETILYTGKTETHITGCTRGFQGIAKNWVRGTNISRLFTAYDYDSTRDNIADLDSRLESHEGNTTTAHGIENKLDITTFEQYVANADSPASNLYAYRNIGGAF